MLSFLIKLEKHEENLYELVKVRFGWIKREKLNY